VDYLLPFWALAQSGPVRVVPDEETLPFPRH
jgi:hypothetical protein